MAPEIYFGKKYDSKCDIFSLGVIFYYLLYYKYPFQLQFQINEETKKMYQKELGKTITFDDKVNQVSDKAK